MNARATIDTKQLEDRLGYRFQKHELLVQALTHRSHGKKNNERLEFLGDSVLNCIVAEILFDKFNHLDEGDLSRVRANLVKQQALYEISQSLALSDYLRLGEGELKSGGFKRPSILADTLEAIIAAIFVEAGFEKVREILRKLYSLILDNVDPKTLGKDDKTLLQEYLQGHQLPLPVYQVTATTGVAHNQNFEVECCVEPLEIRVSGTGTSRRAAEQSAAKLALIKTQKALPQILKPSKKLIAKKKKSLLEPSQGDEQLNLTLKG
jgi:ribonuclease-3